MKIKKRYRAKITADPQAQELNQMMDDVARSVQLGRYLDDLLHHRFSGNLRKFAKWVRDNLDRDVQTIYRKIVIARNADVLRKAGIVRLSDAYSVLDLLGSCTLTSLRP